MSRPPSPDSHNWLSDDPGTVQLASRAHALDEAEALSRRALRAGPSRPAGPLHPVPFPIRPRVP